MKKRGLEEKFSARRAMAQRSDARRAAAGEGGGLVPDRGSRRFRQAFHKRLAFAQQTGALPSSSFDPLSGMRGFQKGLKVDPQLSPMGTFSQLPRRKA